MVRELWRVYDADGSEEIDYGEFAMFMEDMHELLMGNRLISDAQIRGTLALLDEDENGSIDWEGALLAASQPPRDTCSHTHTHSSPVAAAAEFRDYFKGYMLPDQDSFAEMRRDPASEVEAKVDEALEKVPVRLALPLGRYTGTGLTRCRLRCPSATARRSSASTRWWRGTRCVRRAVCACAMHSPPHCCSGVPLGKVRREEKLRRRMQDQEVPKIRENELEAELMGKAITRKDYLRCGGRCGRSWARCARPHPYPGRRQRKDLGLGDLNPWTNGDKDGTIRPSNWT